MATYQGVVYESEQGERSRDFAQPPIGADFDDSLIDVDLQSGTRSKQERIVTGGDAFVGMLCPDQADQTVFGNIFVDPLAFDLGFITERAEHEISIWNADYDNVAEIQAITKINENGLEFDHPTIPIDIARGDGEVHTFAVLKDGPAVQSSYFVYTINSIIYTIEIAGKRIYVWPYFPNWKTIDIEYKLETIIYRSPAFVEQRRPLLTWPERKISAEFLHNENMAERIFHETNLLARKVLAIAVWPEQATPTAPLQGLSILPVNEDLTGFWNLKNYADFVLLQKKSDPHVNELKEIVSVDSGSIEVAVEVAGEFTVGDTLIYPVMIGIIDQKKHEITTDRLLSSRFSFREVKV